MQRRRTARSWGVASIFLIYQVSYHLPSKRHCTISVLPFDVIVSYKCCKDAHLGHKLATERSQRVHHLSLKCTTLRARRLAVIRKRNFASFYCTVHFGQLYATPKARKENCLCYEARKLRTRYENGKFTLRIALLTVGNFHRSGALKIEWLRVVFCRVYSRLKFHGGLYIKKIPNRMRHFT